MAKEMSALPTTIKIISVLEDTAVERTVEVAVEEAGATGEAEVEAKDEVEEAGVALEALLVLRGRTKVIRKLEINGTEQWFVPAPLTKSSF